MLVNKIILYLALWSFAGCFVFSLFVLFVFRTGIVWKSRGKNGLLKKKQSITGLVNMLFLLAGIIGLQVCANYFGLKQQGIKAGFLFLFIVNFIHYCILFFYDTFVIDFLVLVKWQPRFLRIPKEMTHKSMKKHILISIPVGLAYGVVISLVSSVISYFAFFR